jgi:hypothetical protein
MSWAMTIRAQNPRNIHTNSPLLSSRAPLAANALEAEPMLISRAFFNGVVFMASPFVSFFVPIPAGTFPGLAVTGRDAI